VSSRARRWAAGGALLLGGLAALVGSDLPAHWLVLEDPRERVDAAVVMAGDPYYERTGAAAALVRSGQARLLVVTGGEPGPGDSAQSLREKAIDLGVAAEVIRMEAVSSGTHESLEAIAPILRAEGVQSIALVTSPYHQRRAFLTARKALPGVRIVNRPARPSNWDPRRWWRRAYTRRIVVREYAKLAYYALRGWL